MFVSYFVRCTTEVEMFSTWVLMRSSTRSISSGWLKALLYHALSRGIMGLSQYTSKLGAVSKQRYIENVHILLGQS